MTDTPKPEIEKIQKSGKLLSDIVSRTFPPLIGAAIAGPIGAVAGGVAGSLIKFGLEEFMERWLTPKEVKRVGTSAEFIITSINSRLNNHEELNTVLFDELNGNKSDAEELFEGVLLKCKNQYQEKKIELISSIFVNASFDKKISSITANQLLSIAENMTYRKICIVAFFSLKETAYDTKNLMKEPYSHYPNKQYFIELEILKQDIFELMNQGMIDNDNTVIFTRDDIFPGKMKLTEIGQLFYYALSLDKIDRADVDPILLELNYRKEFGINEKGKDNDEEV